MLSAVLEKMVPVLAVSGEARRVEGKDRPDVAFAQRRDQALKAGALLESREPTRPTLTTSAATPVHRHRDDNEGAKRRDTTIEE